MSGVPGRARIDQHLPWATLAAVGGMLLVLSLAPIGRLLGDPSGAFSSELAAQFGGRARLIGAALLAWSAVLFVCRSRLTGLLHAAVTERAAFVASSRAALSDSLLPRSWLDALALLVIGCATIVPRLLYLSQPIRNDEAITIVEFASQPLLIGLSYYPAPNNHLLHTLLVHGAFTVFGDALWAIRLPALLAGVVLVPAMLLTGTVLYGRAAGVLAAAIVAGSSILIEYSTNARGYTLLALLFVCQLGLAQHIRRTNNATSWLLLALVGALGFWTMPTMLYGFGIALVWLLLQGAGRRWLLPTLLVAATLAGLAYVPPALVSGPERILANRWVTPLALTEFPTALVQSLGTIGGQWLRDVPLPLALALGVGLVAAQVQLLRARRVTLVLATLVWCVPVLLLQRVAPFDRVWLFLLPALCIEAAAGLVALVRLPERAASAVGALVALWLAASAVTSGAILTSEETGVFPEAEAVTRVLAPLLNAETAVQTCVRASLPELQYYFGRQGLDDQALVRPTSAVARAYVLVERDPSECTAAVVGARPIDWQLWAAPREVAQVGEVRVLELTRADSGSSVR